MNKWRNWDSKFNWLCKQQCTSLKDWLGYHRNFQKKRLRVWGILKWWNFKLLNKIPSLMDLKILMIGTYESMKEIHYKIKAEFTLKVFDVAEIKEEIDKIVNLPTEVEALDPKKVKDKQVIEESQQN